MAAILNIKNPVEVREAGLRLSPVLLNVSRNIRYFTIIFQFFTENLILSRVH
jgi:hypothetical protein